MHAYLDFPERYDQALGLCYLGAVRVAAGLGQLAHALWGYCQR